jgi:hypothetical protein
MQQHPDPRDVRVQAAYLIEVVFTALKEPSRLRRLSWWCSMVMQSSSPERRHSSSACKSIVAHKAIGGSPAILRKVEC